MTPLALIDSRGPAACVVQMMFTVAARTMSVKERGDDVAVVVARFCAIELTIVCTGAVCGGGAGGGPAGGGFGAEEVFGSVDVAGEVFVGWGSTGALVVAGV